jgi:hypothetical protein
MTTHICGIDIGKTVFHLVGLSKEGYIIVKKHFNRKQLLTYTVNLPACLNKLARIAWSVLISGRPYCATAA